MGITVIKKDGGSGGGGGAISYLMEGRPFTSITSTSLTTFDSLVLAPGKLYSLIIQMAVSTNGVATTGGDILIVPSASLFGTRCHASTSFVAEDATIGYTGRTLQNPYILAGLSDTVTADKGALTSQVKLDLSDEESDVTLNFQARVSTGRIYIETYTVTALEITQ